ncbi:LL-diaminopimelate aminotransferase [Bacillus luteolus]|uniref:Aminotransferase n=1 Tax=Litchfieldia luteola TaxID=682179 RepID=A0ABR9QN79_9BACI|nr:LL-diaminopimelate aminotransferase [Cytobacillus luteolus]MBE4909963.1 LL-diaminopimelate aminotransferase [Cytobacillus luteolus]MBP1942480.1 aspartate/methionine/tyrosine aminotransferase [Cytobacillus luteolus]
MKFTVATRMNAFKESVFNELLKFKKQLLAEGRDIVDLSVGSPDLPPPNYIMDELNSYVNKPTSYGYTLTAIEEFKEAVCTYYNNKYQVSLELQSEVLMVMGSQDGLVHLPMVFANPGDFILVPDPGYTAYATAVAMAGAKPYPMPLLEQNEFLPDLSSIPKNIADQAKMMILNFPGNPIPALATVDFFREVISFAKKYNIIVVHDFAYSELYYEQEKPISFLSVEGAKEVGVEFNSLSKSFNLAGCRIGYIVGNQEIIHSLNVLKGNLDYGVFLPVQKAAIAALTVETDFSDQLRATYKKRRDKLVNGLSALGWKVTSPSASMFVWARIPNGTTSTKFAYDLLDKAGVVVTPGNAFGESGEGYVRIALVQDEVTLERAISQIKSSGLFTND